MDHSQHNRIVSFIWNIADDVLRDVFVRGKYRDIILPFTVLRRLDTLLAPTHGKVLKKKKQLDSIKLENQDPQLCKAAGQSFYNTSNFTFEKLTKDSENIIANLENYLNGFSPNVQDIINKFKVRNQLETIEEADIGLLLIQKYCSPEINLGSEPVVDRHGNITHPGLSNLGMGYVFEELIRKFNEENNEEAGEHFTPREIIRLMTHLIFEPLRGKLKTGKYLIYDPACGSGGMLTESENFAKSIVPNADFTLFGQEINPETYAICKADMLIQNEDPDKIVYGSTLSKDGFPTTSFDFMLSNPPYGKSWKNDYDSIVGDKKEIIDHRFSVGTPRSSDGQLLFLQNMVSKMQQGTKLGSRIATVHNGSALFTGDAGSGESEIRKHIIEEDYLECIIQMPNDMFYNTGISTYIWVLSNRKPEHRKGKIQLIDASEIYKKMRKGLGKKSNEFTNKHIDRITEIYLKFEESKVSKIFDNEDFGYHKIIVERPLRLKSQFTDEGIATLRFIPKHTELMQWMYEKFGEKVNDDSADLEKEVRNHLKTEEIKFKLEHRKLWSASYWNDQKKVMNTAIQLKAHFGEKTYMDFNIFSKKLKKQLAKVKTKLSSAELKQIINVITERDEDAEKVIKKKAKDGIVIYEVDAELRDSESIPLKEDIQEYFELEVIPYVPDAWIDHSKTKVGYEISFTKIFYKYQPLRSLTEVAQDIEDIINKTASMAENII